MNPASVLAVSAVGILLLAPSKAAMTPWLVWSASLSVPIGFYVIVTAQPRRGDLVLVRLPPHVAEFAQQRDYLTATRYLLKPVAAVAGDRVCRFGHRILVHGEHVANALSRDRHGRAMPVWHGCRQLGSGDVFLLAGDARSFDSRYFGPLSAEHVAGRAERFWLSDSARQLSHRRQS